VAEGYSAAFQVVRGQFHRDTVPLGDSDVILSHLPGDMTEQIVPVFKFHPELAIRESFRNDTLDGKPF
jgi:hypothetical protein